jgi:hypothetical protein
VVCVVVPAGWGVLMYFVFNALSAKRAASDRDVEPPPVDYSI